MLDEQARMELFSEAYVRALASRWGFDVVRHQTDKQSIDVQITTVGRHEFEGKTARFGSVPVMAQLKCTYAHQAKDGILKFPLEVKNYDDLRGASTCARILIVVCVPKEWTDRLVWTPTDLRLLRCGYWTSLTGAEPTSNTKTITVELRNCLSVDELGRIMYLASEGEL